MTRAELIAALEKAEGPSRELDAEISLHVGWKAMQANHPSTWPFPPYTASIDAALTLVPDDLHWSIYSWNGSMSKPKPYVQINNPDDIDHPWDADGATPAIALCIASLKARGE